jgi:hypothetical protein
MPHPTRPPAEPPSPSFLDWEHKYPRLAELYRRTKMDDPKNYFVGVLDYLAYELPQEVLDLYERGIAQLAPDDFEVLVQKCKRPVVQPEPPPGRMYTPLFSLLNETWGYLFLGSEGYDPVHFIRAGAGIGNTPEACGHRAGRVALIEVKSFGESADDREAMNPKSDKFRARDATLDPEGDSEDLKEGGIFYRLGALINDERTRQLSYQSPHGAVERRIFLVLVDDVRVMLSAKSREVLREWARKHYPDDPALPDVRVEYWRTFAISLVGAPAETPA